MHRKKQKNCQKGSITIEYVIITLFSIALSIGSLAIVRNTIKNHLDPIFKKHGIEEDILSINSSLDLEP